MPGIVLHCVVGIYRMYRLDVLRVSAVDDIETMAKH